MTQGSTSTFARTVLMVSAIAALAWLLIARISGPSDVWDHTQPKTVSYTTDILVNGNWVLPIERGALPATKPPLYNWIAAPVVAVIGFNSEWAHKFPSILALVLCWAVTIALGARIDRKHGGLVGWLAGFAAVTTQMFFKLGYLARPDMLLTLWLTLGWIAATALILNDNAKVNPKRLLRLGFWMCVALAGMTKGPAAFVLIIYALLGGKLLTGRWSATGCVGWLWGLPVALVINGAWIYAVWRVNPDHLVNELWGAEIAGRITGTGPKGAEGAGPWYPLTSLTYMPYYFLTRLLPWSVLAILAMVHLWRRNLNPPHRNWTTLQADGGAWYQAAAVYAALVVLVFSISTGKRADYIAGAVTPACLLASWWLLRVRSDVARWTPRLAPVAGAIALAALTVDDRLQPLAPSKGYGEEIRTFIDDAERAIDNRPMPLVFLNSGESHVQAFLGESELDGLEPVEAQLNKGESFWVIEGPPPTGTPTLRKLLRETYVDFTMTPTVVSEPEVPGAVWQGTTTLWLVEPKR